MENLSCIILAGGESRRMGEDKGLKLFKKQALVTYSIQLAKKLCKNIYISTNNADYKRFGFPIIQDIILDKGPMGGIYSGLLASETEWNLFLPCDTPFLQFDLFLEMKKHMPSNKIVVPKMENKRVHPLIGYYHKDLLPLIYDHLENNRLKMLGLLDETETYFQSVKKEESRSFLNLNTLEELRNNES